MERPLTYTNCKGNVKFLYEEGFYFLRAVLHNLDIKLNSNTYLVLRQFFMDRKLACNFKSRETIAAQIGPIAGRTVSRVIKILLDHNLLYYVYSSNKKGLALNRKKIDLLMPLLKKQYPVVYQKQGRAHYCSESIYVYEKKELEKKLTANGISYLPAHLDTYIFLASHQYDIFTLSSRKMAKLMLTVSNRTLDKIKDDFEKAGVIHYDQKDKTRFIFNRLNRSPGTYPKAKTECENMTLKRENSAGKTAKILPHKNFKNLVSQEEQLKMLKKSTGTLPIKNESQIYQFMLENNLTRFQIDHYILPQAKLHPDPILYLNHHINQFQYIQKYHQYRIWKQNKPMFLFNLITKNWTFDEYFLYLTRKNHITALNTPEKTTPQKKTSTKQKNAVQLIKMLRKNPAHSDFITQLEKFLSCRSG